MPLEFEIAPNRKIGGDNPCFIIAEIGQNHQGDLQIAKDLIKVAKDAGADCAKFQKSELSFKFNKAALARPYISKNSWGKLTESIRSTWSSAMMSTRSCRSMPTN